MALINCSECGKEVSDKATNCPNCGNPICEIKEEYLCCPKCKSKDLHSEHKGFSGGKALAGVVLTGGVGLLAGTIGSRDVQITCLKCGNKFKAGDALVIKPKIESDNSLDEKLIEIIENENKLAAVKFYKESERVGIAEAKRYVDNLAETKGIISRNNGGCAGVVLLFILVLSSACIYFI